MNKIIIFSVIFASILLMPTKSEARHRTVCEPRFYYQPVYQPVYQPRYYQPVYYHRPVYYQPYPRFYYRPRYYQTRCR